MIQKMPNSKLEVIEPKNEKNIENYYLACSPINAPVATVLIAIRSMNIHQYKSTHFLVFHVSSRLATGPVQRKLREFSS